MTDRIPLDHLTSDALDALYDRIATLESVAAGNKRHVQLIVPELEAADAARRALRERAEQAEAAITRVRALADRWVKAGPPPLGTPMARWWDKRLAELRAVLAKPGPAATEEQP